MSLDHIKREIRKRRKSADKRRIAKKQAEITLCGGQVSFSKRAAVGSTSAAVGTTSASARFIDDFCSECFDAEALEDEGAGGESDDAWLLELAALIETSLESDSTAPPDAAAEPSAEPAADAAKEPPAEPSGAAAAKEPSAEPSVAAAAKEAPGSNEARRALDNMRKLWRAMRRSLPQLPGVNGKEMRKQELADSILSALGVGWAPLPEWGCPEGIDAYMARLMAFAGCLAESRGCAARDLPIPLGGFDKKFVNIQS
jgi:hypothetical protein